MTWFENLDRPPYEVLLEIYHEKYQKLLEFVKEQAAKKDSHFHHICNCDELIGCDAEYLLKEIGEIE